MRNRSRQPVPQPKSKRAFAIWMSVRFEGDVFYLTRAKVRELGCGKRVPYSMILASAAVLGLVHCPRALHFVLMDELRKGRDTQPGDILHLAMEPYHNGDKKPYIMRFTRDDGTISSGSASCSASDLFDSNDEFIFAMS